MISLIEVAKNPAYTLSAMLYGLQNPIETEDVKYKVDMNTFSLLSSDGATCYGCAATSTLEVITGRSLVEHLTYKKMEKHVSENFDFGGEHTRSIVFNTSHGEIHDLEQAIDAARRGYFELLMNFFKLFKHHYHYPYDVHDGSLFMKNKSWQDKVPAFEKVIERMHEDHPEWEKFSNVETQKITGEHTCTLYPDPKISNLMCAGFPKYTTVFVPVHHVIEDYSVDFYFNTTNADGSYHDIQIKFNSAEGAVWGPRMEWVCEYFEDDEDKLRQSYGKVYTRRIAERLEVIATRNVMTYLAHKKRYTEKLYALGIHEERV